MSYPLFIIHGPAGSGKDTFASAMCKAGRGVAVAVAQADLMKRVCQALFGFTNEQLWGPSENRNQTDSRVDDFFSILGIARSNSLGVVRKYFDRTPHFLEEMLMEVSPLNNWFDLVQDIVTKDPSKFTPRMILQTFGTEFGRAIDVNMWSDYAIDVAGELVSGGYSYTPQDGLIEDSSNPGYNFAIITDGRFRNELLNVKNVSGEVIRIDAYTNEAAVEKAGVVGHASEAELKTIPESWNDYIYLNRKSGLDQLEVDAKNFVKKITEPKMWW